MCKKLREFTVGKGMTALLLLAVAVAAFSGCSAQEALAVDAADDGSQIGLQKGQELVVALEANPSTDYTWEMVDSEGDILQQVGEPQFQAQSDLVGASGIMTFRFQAIKAGQMELKLVYHRPWEEGVEPLKTFTLQVTVS